MKLKKIEDQNGIIHQHFIPKLGLTKKNAFSYAVELCNELELSEFEVLAGEKKFVFHINTDDKEKLLSKQISEIAIKTFMDSKITITLFDLENKEILLVSKPMHQDILATQIKKVEKNIKS